MPEPARAPRRPSVYNQAGTWRQDLPSHSRPKAEASTTSFCPLRRSAPISASTDTRASRHRLTTLCAVRSASRAAARPRRSG